MLTRRSFATFFVAGVFASATNAHTMFNQWIVYRKKHLLIGSHRQDLVTYDLALDLALNLGHLLPEAKARAARAPHVERLASLLATRQLELAIISRGNAKLMLLGEAQFAPYGAIPLMLIADLRSHLLVAHSEFKSEHAWLLTAALNEAGLGLGTVSTAHDLIPHPGTSAFHQGLPLSALTSE